VKSVPCLPAADLEKPFLKLIIPINCYGVFERYLGVYEDAEKILVVAANTYFAAAWILDHIYKWLGCCTIYLHIILNRLIMPEAILGISAYYHDSAAAIIVDGEIVAAAQEERFTRKKHDSSFPANAVKYVLDESGIGSSDLLAVVFMKNRCKVRATAGDLSCFCTKRDRKFSDGHPGLGKGKTFYEKNAPDRTGKTLQRKLSALVS
jgi:hypothetical protein